MPTVFAPRRLLEYARTDPSSLSLVVSNLVTIGLALVQNWSLAGIMWIYWSQSVIIGLFTTAKILAASPGDAAGGRSRGRVASAAGRIGLALFFTAHYGLFHFGYFQFLRDLPDGGEGTSLLAASGVFFLNHLFSFFYNLRADRGRGPDRERGNLGHIFRMPYLRIIPMHITILVGFPITRFIGTNRIVLTLFLLLKTYVDVSMHAREHRADNPGGSSSPRPEPDHENR